MNEVWKPIPGWRGIYEASTAGRIRSVNRWIVQGNRWGQQVRCKRGSRVLSGSPNTKGYLTVTLNGDGRRQNGVAVHSLIALAFFGPRPEGYQVCHGKGGKADNSVGNLRYGTPADNLDDARRENAWPAGTRHYKCRLDIDEEEVLRLRSEGWTQERLARQFGIGETTVRRILAGRRFNKKAGVEGCAPAQVA